MLYQHVDDKSLSIEIVSNKQGLKMLVADNSMFAQPLEQLTNMFNTLKVVACARSLAQPSSKG
jgi:intracellular sulfur oxidation DsrE/DsrF family protein